MKGITIRWTDIAAVEIDTGGNFNVFLQAAKGFIASLREAPSNRKMRLRLSSGISVELHHWHSLDSTTEIENLINELWKADRTFGYVTDAAGHPIVGAMVVARVTDADRLVCITDHEGYYSLNLPRTQPVTVIAEMEGCVADFKGLEATRNAHRMASFSLTSLGEPRYIKTEWATRTSKTSVIIRPNQRANRGCAVTAIKLACAAVGFFACVFLPLSFLLLTKDVNAAVRWMKPSGILIVFAIGLGWRLGDRIAYKLLRSRCEVSKDDEGARERF